MAEKAQYQISGDGKTYFDAAIKNLLYGEIPVMHSCGGENSDGEEIKIRGGSDGDWIEIENKTPAAYCATIRTTGLYYTGKYSTPIFYTLENGNYKYVEADVRYSDDRKYITVYSNANSDLYFTFVSSCKDWRSFIETKDMLYYEPVYSSNGETVSYAVGVRSGFKDVISEITSSDILSVYNGKPVTKIDEDGFRECYFLKSVMIPNSVTEIGVSAFRGCSGLTSIEIPNGVTHIVPQTFYGCSSLVSVTIPNGVTDISLGAFYDCTSLTSIEIPGSVTTIGPYAFRGCTSITSITIPYRVTTIGDSAFRGCTGLTSITLPFVGAAKDGTDNTHFGYIFGASSWSENKTAVPNLLKTVEVKEYSLYSIASNSFYGCSSIETIKLLGHPRSFGYDAFKGCTGLSRVYINNLEAWCTATFEPGASEMNAPTVYSNPLYRGSEGAYKSRDLYINDKKVETLEINNSITNIIKEFAFCGCTMTKLQISAVYSEYSSDIIIGKYAFAWCKNLEEADVRQCSFGEREYEGKPVDQKCIFMDCPSLKIITISCASKEIPFGFVTMDQVSAGALRMVDLYQFVGEDKVVSFRAPDPNTGNDKAFCCWSYLNPNTNEIDTNKIWVRIDGQAYEFEKQKGSSAGGTGRFYGTWAHSTVGGTEMLNFENDQKVSYGFAKENEPARYTLPVVYAVSDGFRTSLLYDSNALNREIDEDFINLTNIGDYAFKSHAADGVYVPRTVTAIGLVSFGASPSSATTEDVYDSSYASSIIINPDGNDLVINNYAFRFFYNTTRLHIPSRVTYIGAGAFFELGFGVYITHTNEYNPQNFRCLTYIYRPYPGLRGITTAAQHAFGNPADQRADKSYYDHWKAFQLFVPAWGESNYLSKYQSTPYWNEYVKGTRYDMEYEYRLQTRRSDGILDSVPLLTTFDPTEI